MSRPLIGIATQTLEAVPGELPRCWIMGQRYVRSLTSVGAIPWLIPLITEDEPTLREIYNRLDGLFMVGGVDIDPSQYGEPRHKHCDRSDAARDWTELTLIRWALADGKPILGVCRGIQALNVACGGSLYQHVPEEYPAAIKHDYFPTAVASEYTRDFLAHNVEITPHSRLYDIMGVQTAPVNSMHHQGIKHLAPGLMATAFAPDGLIEGVEVPEQHFAIAVQWHPEELVDRHPPMRQLFTGFVAAAKH